MSRTRRKFSNPLPPAGEESAGKPELGQHAVETEEGALDEALMESFPASDPVAVNFSWVVRHPARSTNEHGRQA